MMFIITDADAVHAVRNLINQAPKTFVAKQLLELGQLICSAGISDVFKAISRGKEIQQWIKDNPMWTYRYFVALYNHCKTCVSYQPITIVKFNNIKSALLDYSLLHNIEDPVNAVFRYSKDYTSTDYATNSLLPIHTVVNEYKKYLNWKADVLHWDIPALEVV